MRGTWTRTWRIAKALLAVLIVVGVGWQFVKILRRPELWEQRLTLEPAWLTLAGVLYAAGFACWGGYWWRLLAGLGEKLPWPAAARAYFVSQLGKYVPGKAVAIVMRVAMARSAGVRTSVAALTATYETLTTIAAGAIVAALLFPLLGGGDSAMGWKALGLLAIAGIPILPGVFNRLATRIARPFIPRDAPPLPRLTVRTLVGGLLQTSVGWLCLGTSLVALLRGIDVDGAHLSLPWLNCIAYVAVSYVAGFLTLPAPGGLGVREAILQQLLAGQLAFSMSDAGAESFAVVIVLLLRLIWTAAELSLAGAAALLPCPYPGNVSA